MSAHYPVLIDASQIYQAFHQQTLLDNISIQIRAKEFISIIGLNGSGKSTLLKLLLKLSTPSKGSVTHAENLRIGYVPQTWHPEKQIPMTVIAMLALHGKQLSQDTLMSILSEWQLASAAKQSIHQLSGGQWQRLLLACALLNKPNLLVLDEPTQGLDLPTQHAFYQRMKQLHQTGTSILMVSHDLAHALSYSERIIALADGKVCCQGTPSEVMSNVAYQQRFICAHTPQCLHEHPHA